MEEDFQLYKIRHTLRYSRVIIILCVCVFFLALTEFT